MRLSLLRISAGSQWEQQPERYFGKVHIQVDSQDAEVDAYTTSSDEGSDFSNMSQAGSASEDEEDELPFGPARTTKAEDQPRGKSLEMKPAVQDGDIETGISVLLSSQKSPYLSVGLAFMVNQLCCNACTIVSTIHTISR